MNTISNISICLLFVITLVLAGCSKNDKEKDEKSAIDEFNSRTAQKIVRTIQSPIEKAEKVKEAQEDRNIILDEARKN